MDSKAVCADAGVDGAGVPAQDPVALYDALISTTPTLFACGFLKSTLVHFATHTLPTHLGQAEKALQRLRALRDVSAPTTVHEAQVRAAGWHLNLKRIEVLNKLAADIQGVCAQGDRDEDAWHAQLLEAVNVWVVDTMRSLYSSEPGSVTATLFKTMEDMHSSHFNPEATLAFKLRI